MLKKTLKIKTKKKRKKNTIFIIYKKEHEMNMNCAGKDIKIAN